MSLLGVDLCELRLKLQSFKEGFFYVSTALQELLGSGVPFRIKAYVVSFLSLWCIRLRVFRVSGSGLHWATVAGPFQHHGLRSNLAP